MRLKVAVTAEHIAAGRPGDPCVCPVALALKAAGVVNAGVGIVTISGFYNGHLIPLDAPEEVRDFVHRFDLKEPVQPFDFELEVRA